MPDKSAKKLNGFWRLGVTLAAVGAWVSVIWLFASPSEASSAFLLGLSVERLALAALVFLPALFFTWVTSNSKRIGLLQTWISESTQFWGLFASVSLLLFTSWTFFFLPLGRATVLLGPYSLYLERLKPLLFYGAWLGIVFLPLLLLQYFGLQTKTVRGEGHLLRSALIVFALFLLAWGLLFVTRLGLGFDATIWNAPGAPLLSSQILLCLLVVPLLLASIFALSQKFSKVPVKKLDLFITILVWILAAVFWLRQPAQPTYYSSAPRPPTEQSFPLSDAFNHDVIANNVLVGEGFHFGGLVAIRRPLYIMFLAGLEAIFGSNYSSVVSAQVVVLALFPALLYLLAAKLHNRFSGLLLASLITIREANSIALGHVVNMSHAKLLMADLPTALAMAGLGLAAVVWLRGSARNGLSGLFSGALLGAFILLRSQTLTLIPFFILLAFLVWGWRAAWRQAALFVIGTVLVASPWIIRNRVEMGQWAIEDSVVSGFLANRYRFDPGTFGLPFLAGESEGEYYARQMASVREFALQNPGYVAGFVADNFVRNQLLNFMSLPVSLQLRDLESHVRELPYWPSWNGHLAPESVLPILANLFLVALGLVVAWRETRWAGMVPLFINIGFTANLALARVSGWRYNLPADWTVFLYYALGVGQLFIWCLALLRANPIPNRFAATLKASTPSLKRRQTNWPTRSQWIAAFAAVLLAGNSFLIVEALSHPRYHRLSIAETQEILASSVAASTSASAKEQLQALLAQGDLTVLSGRALYPAFYRSGEGAADSSFSLTLPMDFKRITFFVVGPDPASVALRLDNPKIDFPSGSDVVVLRCDRNALEAAAVIVLIGNSSSSLLVSADLAQTCPQLDS